VGEPALPDMETEEKTPARFCQILAPEEALRQYRFPSYEPANTQPSATEGVWTMPPVEKFQSFSPFEPSKQ